MLVLGLFAIFQVGAFLIMLAIVVDFGFEGVFLDFGIIELFVSLFLAVLASIAFGLFLSSIVPSQDVVLYAILAQLFVQIILTGTLFPLDNSPLSMGVPGYWAAVSAGSTVDLPGLNENSRICSVNEVPNMQTGAKELKVICNEAEQELKIPYEHTEKFVFSTWIGMTVHIFIWVLLTIIVQGAKESRVIWTSRIYPW